MFTNKLTTIFGTIAAIAAGGATQTTGKVQAALTLIATLAGAVFAFVAKDHNVTGGTKQQ